MGIGKKGFTLVEIIVSLAIMTIVAGAVGAFVIAGNNSYMRGNKELTLQEEAQLTANQMIDLIIDVEKGISFSNLTDQKAVDMDGNVAKALRSWIFTKFCHNAIITAKCRCSFKWLRFKRHRITPGCGFSIREIRFSWILHFTQSIYT